MTRAAGRAAALVAAALAGGYGYTCYSRRPLSPVADPARFDAAHRLRPPPRRRRAADADAADGNLPAAPTPSPPRRSFRAPTLASDLASAFTLAASTALCQAYLATCDVSIERLDAFRALLADARRDGAPVLTVSNHMSTVDDPVIVSTLVPLADALRSPRAFAQGHRWGGCSEEICFKNRALASFFGAGKVLPVWRGGGISQDMFAELAAHLEVPGRWVHLFPEGTICQQRLLRADVPSRRRDYLRWGVGKMVARATVAVGAGRGGADGRGGGPGPIVVPFYHDGLERALPLEEGTGASLRRLPKLGVPVRIRFGPPIPTADLVEAYVSRHGTAALEAPWDAPEPPELLQLYADIADRVRGAMEALDLRPDRLL